LLTKAALLGAGIATIASLSLVGCVEEHRDWSFIQSVGGMAVGIPYRTERGVMLPDMKADSNCLFEIGYTGAPTGVSVT